MSTNANLYLHRTFLAEIMNERPDKSKEGYRQSFIWREFLDWRDFGTRNVLMQRAKTQNQLAGLYGPQGTALPRPRIGAEQWLSTMMDVKAYDFVDPDIVRDDIALGELLVTNSLETVAGRALRAKVREYIERAMAMNEDVVDNTLEYLTIGALKNSIVWPPVDNAGNAISPPPVYWNADVSGTWQVGLPTDLNQDIAALVDKDGNAATADQRKYWSDTTADIIGALDVVDQICIEKYAFSIAGGTIIARSTLIRNNIIKNADILNFLRGNDNTQPGARGFITPRQLELVFPDAMGYTFRPYDAFWTWETPAKNADYTSNTVFYLNPNEIIIIPPGGVQGWMGTAPLEREDGDWQPGMMPWLYKDPRPNFRREMGVHATAWPIFARTEWVRLQVLA